MREPEGAFARERLRIAILTYSTQPRGGVVHACALAEALADLGHEAVLFAVDDPARTFARPPRCPFVRVPVANVKEPILPFVRRRIAAYVDYFSARLLASARAPQAGGPRLDFDVYHAQDGISGNALTTLVEKGAIPSFVRTIHHVDEFSDRELATLQDRSIERAAKCFVVSEVWRERVRDRYGLAARVVPNGVDLERFSPISRLERDASRVVFGFASPTFLTIGGIEPRKNTLASLEAFALVRATVPAARLVIAGGASVFEHGAYARAFAARSAELGLDDGAVLVTGVVDDATIVALLRAADAFVFPSLVEGFGLVLLEALACGTPVIASALAPFTEFLSQQSALLVDPRSPDAIAAAMLRSLEPHVARPLRERGPHVARTFTWRASAQRHVDYYRGAYEIAI
jgi:glycosyltransferase-like protein